MSKFSQQFANASWQYDNAAPDDGPAFGMVEAVGSVAIQLDDCDTAELVQEVIDCQALFAYLSSNVMIPAKYLREFRAIAHRCDGLAKKAESEYETMNAPFSPDDDE